MPKISKLIKQLSKTLRRPNIKSTLPIEQASHLDALPVEPLLAEKDGRHFSEVDSLLAGLKPSLVSGKVLDLGLPQVGAANASHYGTVPAYTKTLKTNECGYRRGVPGQAGAFILIPQQVALAGLVFPLITETGVNPSVDLVLISKHSGRSYRARLIHENNTAKPRPDGTRGKDRDEFRLYGDWAEMEPSDQRLNEPDQKVTFRRVGPNAVEFEFGDAPAVAAPAVAGHPGCWGGRRPTTVSTRVGQASFRKYVLATYGSACLFSGTCPIECLDAAHLYSFAKVGVHRLHGGVPLRKDLHALLDAGALLVDPTGWTMWVHPAYRTIPHLAALHGRPVLVRLHPHTQEWFRSLWAEAEVMISLAERTAA